jgi:hypothetical protein
LGAGFGAGEEELALADVAGHAGGSEKLGAGFFESAQLLHEVGAYGWGDVFASGFELVAELFVLALYKSNATEGDPKLSDVMFGGGAFYCFEAVGAAEDSREARAWRDDTTARAAWKAPCIQALA